MNIEKSIINRFNFLNMLIFLSQFTLSKTNSERFGLDFEFMVLDGDWFAVWSQI